MTVDFEPTRDPPGIRVEATAKVEAKTGVEMEALTAVAVACLTIYDMVQGGRRGMRSPASAGREDRRPVRHVSPLIRHGCSSPSPKLWPA